jgi:hypothetical protein
MREGEIPVYTDEKTPQFDEYTGDPLNEAARRSRSDISSGSGTLSELLSSHNLMEYEADLNALGVTDVGDLVFLNELDEDDLAPLKQKMKPIHFVKLTILFKPPPQIQTTIVPNNDLARPLLRSLPSLPDFSPGQRVQSRRTAQSQPEIATIVSFLPTVTYCLSPSTCHIIFRLLEAKKMAYGWCSLET